MTLPQILGAISGALLIVGYIPYIYEVATKKTVPNRASWFIWSLSTIVLLFGVKETGTHEAIWVPVADAVGCTLIFLLSIPLGVGGWSKTDRISLFVSLASLFLWWYTGSAFVALVANLVVYVSGYVPTIRKAWIMPGKESKVAWSFFFAGVLLNLATVAIGTDTGLSVWLYPIVLVATVGTLYAILWKKPALAE
ncbi:MAG: hypothetical protein HZA81_02515 [Candidatus Taylorbacteria bacterium]|nr:hypothetical protein [Candidatus Taylorbacteria bacterium]